MTIRWLSLLLFVPPLGGFVFAAELPPPPAGFYVTPSFSIAEVYSDNIFYTPSDPREDFITRFSPGILAGYESLPLTILAGYSFDAEAFANHSELSNALSRQKATTNFRYLPTRLLTLATKFEYTETRVPGELNTLTGVIASSRARAQRFLLDPSVAYRFDPLTTGTLGYTYTNDSITERTTTDTHIARFNLSRRITPRDILSGEYTFHRFIFRDDGSTDAHVPGVGWTREVTPTMNFTLRGGPRISEGSIEPEVLASIGRRFAQGEFALTYARTLTTVAGEVGTVKTDGVSMLARYRMLPSLELSLMPTYHRARRGTTEADTYGVRADVGYDILNWLSLVASYEYRLQKGILEGSEFAGDPGDRISNNIFFISLVAKNRLRFY